MKHILHLISSARLEGGGPIEGIRQLATTVLELGSQVEIACLDAPDQIDPSDYPVPIHALGPGRGNYCWAPQARAWLQQHLPKYDVLILDGIWQYHGVLGRSVALKVGVPYYVFPHGMLDPYFNRSSRLKHIKKALYWPVQHRVLRDARAVLFTCEQEKILARESFRPYRVREKVVRYGTAGPSEEAEAQVSAFLGAFPMLSGKPFLLYLSRIHPKKGCDLMLQAYAKVYHGTLDAPWLVMAGPDQVGWGPELRSLADRLGIADRVFWTGMLQGPAKWGAYRACEAFVLPSHQENFGIVVAEALACSKPVLLSREVNIWREVIEDGAGLAEPDTLAGTESLLRRWAALPEHQRLAMGEAAKACFTHRFEIRAAALSFLEAIQD